MDFFTSPSPSDAVDSVGVYSYVANNFSIALAIVVALVATALVFFAARKMRGGVFGTVLNYFGAGMLAVVAGYVVTIVPPLAAATSSYRVQDIAFMVGYVLMLLGARRLAAVFGPQA